MRDTIPCGALQQSLELPSCPQIPLTGQTDPGQLIASFQGNLPESAAGELAPDKSSELKASVTNWRTEWGNQEVGWGPN